MLDVDIGSVRGRSKVEVAKEAPSLGEGGEVFSQNLPRSLVDVWSELPAQCT